MMRKTLTRREMLRQTAVWGVVFWVRRYGGKTAVSAPQFAPTNDVAFAWSGSMTPSGGRVVAWLKRESEQVRLLVSAAPNLANPRFSAVAQTDGNRLVVLTAAGLGINGRYYYALEVDGVVDTNWVGQFHTVGHYAYSFQFACASCARTNSNHPVFDTIRQQQPHFFVHMGDMHYENIDENEVQRFHEAYRLVWSAPAQAALYRQVPLVYTWDDHDFGGNGSDRMVPSRAAARVAYQACVPHHPLLAGVGDVPIYQAFTVGRVRFLLTDGRSERSPFADPDDSQKTVLGVAQKSWLKEALLAASQQYPLVVWINEVPWVGASNEDGWGLYQTERAELSDFLRANQINNLLMLSGDAHMVAIDDGSNTNYATGGSGVGFPLLHAGALDSSPSLKGGPYSHGAFPGAGQFGLVRVEDEGGTAVRVTLEGRTAQNSLLTQYQFERPAPPAPKLFFPWTRGG